MAKYDEIIKYNDHIMSRNIVHVTFIAIWAIFIVQHMCVDYHKGKIYVKSKSDIPTLIGSYIDYIHRQQILKHVCIPHYRCCALSGHYITIYSIIIRVKQNHYLHCKSTQQDTSFIPGHVYHSKYPPNKMIFGFLYNITSVHHRKLMYYFLQVQAIMPLRKTLFQFFGLINVVKYTTFIV
eukprot:493316_1